jgi:transcriptional regulator with XRE-family HTH domain
MEISLHIFFVCYKFVTMIRSKEIAKRIRKVRELKGMTQQELADKLNTDRVYVTQIESGKVNMSVDYLQRICDALECKLHVIIEP